MKKEVKRYVVMDALTEDSIKGNYASRYFANIVKKWWYLFIIYLIGVFVPLFIYKNSEMPHWLTYTIMFVTIIGFFLLDFNAWQYGKKQFNKIKDLPEPIDLRNIK